MLFSCRLFLIYANVRHLHTINFKASLPFSSINIFSYHNHNAFKVIQRCFRITCHKHQISHFEEYRNKSYYCSCNILYPWYPKRQENLIVIWMQMLLMVKNFLQSQIVTAKPYVSSEQILNILNRIHIKHMYNS